MEIVILINNQQKNMQNAQDITYTKLSCWFFSDTEVNLKNNAPDSSSSANLLLQNTKAMLQSSAFLHPIYTGKPPADELTKKQSSSAALFSNSKVPDRGTMLTFECCFSGRTEMSRSESKGE